MALSDDAIEFMRLSNEADSENRSEGLADLKFVSGDQWPVEMVNSRTAEARPCLTINKLDGYCRQVSNQQRQQRPRMKVHPTNGIATKKIGDVIQGLLRHIEVQSSADTAYDTAFDSAVKIGWGYWRILTDYAREDSFDQEIYIGQIENPFTVYFDPSSVLPDGSDSEKCLIADTMTKQAFRLQYPDAQDSNFTQRGTGDMSADWITKEDIRIAEYFYIDHVKATLLKLSDGSIIWADELPTYKAVMAKMGIGVKAERPSYKRKVKWCKVTAFETLEKEDWMGRWIPIVPVYGNIVCLDGKRKKSGMVRMGKDPQRMINYWETAATESIALAPKAKWLMEEEQDEGHENEWSRANQSSFPVLKYRSKSDDSGAPLPPPQRLQPEPPPEGIINALQISTSNLREVLGISDPAMRVSGNVSGKALNAEKQQSDNSTYHYYDNLTRSLAHTGRICLDLMPHVYDTERATRIVGDDGKPDVIVINQRKTTAAGEVIDNNIKVGQYDIVMDTGPGYNSKRIEAVDAMAPLMANEEIFKVIGDLYFRNSDFPGAEVIADRLAAMNPLAQIDEHSDIPPAAQMQIKQLQTQLQEAMQQLQGAGAMIKDRRDIEQMKQDGETKRKHMDVTVKAHDIEERTKVQREDTVMQVHGQAQDTAAKVQGTITVEELRGQIALLLARIDERAAKEASAETTENAV